MPNIPLVSRLAISFIRPFRSYLDGSLMFFESKKGEESTTEEKISDIVDSIAKINPSIEPDKIAYMKECMLAMNTQMIFSYNKSYEDILPDVIEDLTISLEKEIENSFSEKEIESLIELINNPLMKKLITNKKIFGILKKCEINLDYNMRIKTLDSLFGSEGIEEIKNVLARFRKKYGIKDQEIDEENGDDYWGESDENNNQSL